MIGILLLIIFVVDVVIHCVTIQHWGWMITLSVNMALMLTGSTLFKFSNKLFKWQDWAHSRNSISKKKLKKLAYQVKHSLEIVSKQDHQYIMKDLKAMLLSSGMLLLMMPGLFSGFIGLIMMLTVYCYMLFDNKD